MIARGAVAQFRCRWTISVRGAVFRCELIRGSGRREFTLRTLGGSAGVVVRAFSSLRVRGGRV
jgi:hypothetical protein